MYDHIVFVVDTPSSCPRCGAGHLNSILIKEESVVTKELAFQLILSVFRQGLSTEVPLILANCMKVKRNCCRAIITQIYRQCARRGFELTSF
jgi:hypothetical protein